MNIAIYEPDPRICGPATWARMLKMGFEERGHTCHIVTFTKSGKSRLKWGRVETAGGAAAQCRMVPDVVNPDFDSYDLIVLNDVKCPPPDGKAYTDCDSPDYIYRLSETRTKWTSALHGRWYYEANEVPPRCNVLQGSPFLGELLSLPNFSGFIVEHGTEGQFTTYSERLKSLARTYYPLPYKLQVESLADKRPNSLAVIGRMVTTKYRHVIDNMAIEGYLDGWDITYAGSVAACGHANAEFMCYERLVRGGFEGERYGGIVRPTTWTCKGRAGVQYVGAYVDPIDVLRDISVHVGITDCDFSGGLLEFSTLEAIDCGCIPVVSQPFAVGKCVMGVIHYGFNRIGEAGLLKHKDKDLIFQLTQGAINFANNNDVRKYNREVIARDHNPAVLADLFIQGAL